MRPSIRTLLVQRYAEKGIRATPLEGDDREWPDFNLGGMPFSTLEHVEAVMRACEEVEQLAQADYKAVASQENG